MNKIRINLNVYRKNQFEILKNKYDAELKANTNSVTNKKIDNLNVKITELKPIKIPKPKYKIDDVVRYLLEQPKKKFNEKLSGKFCKAINIFQMIQ